MKREEPQSSPFLKQFTLFPFIFGIEMEQEKFSARHHWPRNMHRAVSVAAKHISFLYSLASFIFNFRAFYKINLIRHVFARTLVEMNSLFTWYSLYLRRGQLRDALVQMHQVAKGLNVVPSAMLVKAYFAWMAAVFISGVVTYVSFQSEEFRQQFINSFTLGLYEGTEKTAYPVFVASSAVFYWTNHVFHAGMCGFHCSLCFYAKKLLDQMRLKISTVTEKWDVIDDVHISIICSSYDGILCSLRSLDDAISRTVFLLQTSNCVSIFTILLKFCATGTAITVTKLEYEKLIFIFASASINFASISYFTAIVNEADHFTKMSLNSFVKKAVQQGFQREEMEPLYLIVNEEAFSFSGWGFFNFTKSLFLSAIGSILTYTLLLTQLE